MILNGLLLLNVLNIIILSMILYCILLFNVFKYYNIINYSTLLLNDFTLYIITQCFKYYNGL